MNKIKIIYTQKVSNSNVENTNHTKKYYTKIKTIIFKNISTKLKKKNNTYQYVHFILPSGFYRVLVYIYTH